MTDDAPRSRARSTRPPPRPPGRSALPRAAALLGPALTAAAAASPLPLRAQAPATDVLVAPLSTADGVPRLGPPVRVTDRPGYDNQPSFEPGGRSLLFTSVREDGQADTYRYRFRGGRVERVTRTPESEYSPTVVPAGDAFSTVRVEADSTQRLWAFDLDGRHPRLLLEDVRPVGYHAWIDDRVLALYVLGDPATLRIVELPTGATRTVARDVGRALQRVPGRRAVSFLRPASAEERWIVTHEPGSGRTERVAPALEGSEDHAWTPRGDLLMGRGSKVFRWSSREDRWSEVADLAAFGHDGITRLAVSPAGDRLAIVVVRPDPPAP